MDISGIYLMKVLYIQEVVMLRCNQICFTIHEQFSR